MSQITINKGSDLNFVINWKNPDGTPFDLTGYTASAYDSVPTLSFVFFVVDAAGGVINCGLPWSENYASYSALIFRIKISDGLNNITTPKIQIYIQ
jgi:hypothetical protein